MSKSKMEITDITIGGIKNPRVYIRGFMSKEIKLILRADDQIFEFSESNDINRNFVFKKILKRENNKFSLYCDIPYTTKKVSISYIEDNKTKLLFEKNYNIFVRIFDRIKLIFLKAIKIPKVLIKVIKLMWERHHFLVPSRLIKQYIKSFKNNINNVDKMYYNPMIKKDYNDWLNKNKKTISINNRFENNPLISIVINNSDSDYLEDCVNSILENTYKNFEIFILGNKKNFNNTFEKNKVQFKDVLQEKIVELINGEFVVFMNGNDLLEKEALAKIVELINTNKNVNLIYSDCDKIDDNLEYCYPHFKPDWSPNTLLSFNYISNLTIYRTNILKKIKHFSNNYELCLKYTELTSNIYHIPKILYHERIINNICQNNLSILKETLLRRNLVGDIQKIENKNMEMYSINFKQTLNPKISIIIPTKDKSEILNKCLNSIYQRTTYSNYEIIVIDNGSVEEDTIKLLNKYKTEHDNFKIIRLECDFNYSYLNNIGIKNADGDYIVLLNNDIEVITDNWLDIMIGYAIQDNVGCVGVKLLYPNYTIQHCGVILGIGGVASHAFVGTGQDSFGYYGRINAPYNYSAVTAACLMIKKSKFLEVDGLDQNLKVAFNDVDLNIKILEKGYYNVVLPQVKLIHYESLSRGNDLDDDKKQRFIEEITYIVNKWKEKILYDNFYNNNFSYDHCFVLNREEESYEIK